MQTTTSSPNLWYSQKWGLPLLTLTTYLHFWSVICFLITLWLVFFETEVNFGTLLPWVHFNVHFRPRNMQWTKWASKLSIQPYGRFANWNISSGPPFHPLYWTNSVQCRCTITHCRAYFCKSWLSSQWSCHLAQIGQKGLGTWRSGYCCPYWLSLPNFGRIACCMVV